MIERVLRIITTLGEIEILECAVGNDFIGVHISGCTRPTLDYINDEL